MVSNQTMQNGNKMSHLRTQQLEKILNETVDLNKKRIGIFRIFQEDNTLLVHNKEANSSNIVSNLFIGVVPYIDEATEEVRFCYRVTGKVKGSPQHYLEAEINEQGFLTSLSLTNDLGISFNANTENQQKLNYVFDENELYVEAGKGLLHIQKI